MDSKDPAFAAVCWFLHTLDPLSDAMVTVGNARDYTRKVVFHAATTKSTVTFEGQTVEYGVETSPPLSTDGKPEPYRSLWMRGPRDCIDALVLKAIDGHRGFMHSAGSTDPGVATWTWDDAWTRGKTRPSRPMSTLFLPPQGHEVLRDFRHFISPHNVETYRELHIAPTRVYMLHGTPGSGKSSLVHCVASDTGYGIATMAFGPTVTDADLTSALESLPPKCLVCIEDIDCLFEGRKSQCGVSFAGLLSALDGCRGHDPGTAVGIFMTTNKLCALDPALKRRIDYIAEFGCATKSQVEAMFAQYFPSHDFGSFWERVHHKRFNMSALQKYLVKCLWSLDPLHAIRDFDALVDVSSSSKDTAHIYS